MGLDPRRFHPLGRKKFDESDKAEWAQWIENNVTAFVPQDLEDKIDKKTLSVPLCATSGRIVAKAVPWWPRAV